MSMYNNKKLNLKPQSDSDSYSNSDSYSKGRILRNRHKGYLESMNTEFFSSKDPVIENITNKDFSDTSLLKKLIKKESKQSRKKKLFFTLCVKGRVDECYQFLKKAYEFNDLINDGSIGSQIRECAQSLIELLGRVNITYTLRPKLKAYLKSILDYEAINPEEEVLKAAIVEVSELLQNHFSIQENYNLDMIQKLHDHQDSFIEKYLKKAKTTIINGFNLKGDDLSIRINELYELASQQEQDKENDNQENITNSFLKFS